jgi:hypothetical protein
MAALEKRTPLAHDANVVPLIVAAWVSGGY